MSSGGGAGQEEEEREEEEEEEKNGSSEHSEPEDRDSDPLYEAMVMRKGLHPVINIVRMVVIAIPPPVPLPPSQTIVKLLARL
ncbi:hypothetical protein NL676_003155 [Syzygium grande]|nr:hypothetical protein NL676_003155 [Syzygium grande]